MKNIELDCEWVLEKMSHNIHTDNNNICMEFRNKEYTHQLFIELALNTLGVKYTSDEYVEQVPHKHYIKEIYCTEISFDIDDIKTECPVFYAKHIDMVNNNKTVKQKRLDKLKNIDK